MRPARRLVVTGFFVVAIALRLAALAGAPTWLVWSGAGVASAAFLVLMLREARRIHGLYDVDRSREDGDGPSA
jgi:hypothetical protein